MANTYTQLYTQYVFSVKGRENLNKETFRDELEKVMCGIVTNHKCKTYAIYANPEHVHFLVSRSPKLSEEILATIVAESVQKFINENKLCKVPFAWQESAAAFSVSKSAIDKVCKYILNQPEHHRKVSFAEEYEEFIKFYQKTLQPSKK